MITVAALYHFAQLEDPNTVQPALLSTCHEAGIKGSLLLAREGINGTIAGPKSGIAGVIDHIRALPGFADLTWKESSASEMPFARLKVRLKREIVTMGQPDVDPTLKVGRYVKPADWNALISEPDVAVIDTRNSFEVAIGTFDGAIDPQTESFRDFPGWWAENKERFAGKRIAMFCTGGIRCEKSTSYLVSQGIEDVFHLQGGILKYLEEVPEKDSLWSGSCYVFDGRVSVEHGLKEGPHVPCHACGRPLSPIDTQHRDYEEGAQCHQCVTKYTDADRDRFRQRHRQMMQQA
ncbi:MAG: rhodanese-related sulfurtransferase [Pseudomonadota bacterium]